MGRLLQLSTRQEKIIRGKSSDIVNCCRYPNEMSAPPRELLSFSVYEDEDCRAGITGSFPSLTTGGPGAGQTGLTTHMPPPAPRPLPSPFTVRVPSGCSSSSSASAASPVAGLGTGQARLMTTRPPRPFTVRVPSTPSSSSSSSSARSGVGPTGHAGLHMAPRFTLRGPAVTPRARRCAAGGRPFMFRVASTSSSSTSHPSGGWSAGVAAGQPGSATSGAHHCAADDGGSPVTVATSSSTGSFYSCLSGNAPPLLGSGEPGTGPAQEQKPTPVTTPRLGRCRRPCRARERHGSPDGPGGANNNGAEKQPPRRWHAQIDTPITTTWTQKASNLNHVDGLEENAPLGGPEGPSDGAHQREQLHTPTETPESRRFVDVLVEDWMRRSIEQDGVAPVVQEGAVDGAARQQPQPRPEQGQEQLPTPADTPASRGFKDVSADAWGGRSPPGHDDVVISDRAEDSSMTGTLSDLEGLSLAADDDDDDGNDKLQAARKPLPCMMTRRVTRPRDALGQFARSPASHAAGIPRRRRDSRVQKGGPGGQARPRRGRRRTEAELTMYHAIRWSGMGGVVPNVSVVTREPLVRMPLPCTFGGGPGRKSRAEEEEDFAVGLSREVVREVERSWAERARKMQPGV